MESDRCECVFAIDTVSGAVSLVTAGVLDYESTQSYVVVVQAESSGITDTLTLTIEVTNVLEELTVSDADGADNTIAENATTDTVVAGLSLEARDEASDLFSAVWSLTDASGLFQISSTSGEISLVTAGVLDYESTQTYEVVVQAANEGVSVIGELVLTIAVTDVLEVLTVVDTCLLYTSPSPRDRTRSRMPSSA